MKISYVLQLKDFCIMLGIGVILGIIYGILNIPNKIKTIRAIQIISDILFSAIAIISFIIFINLINMGEIRFFLCLGYILGFIIERITLGKLFAKGYKYVYNKIVKFFKFIANSKVGKVIFK